MENDDDNHNRFSSLKTTTTLDKKNYPNKIDGFIQNV